MGPTSVGLVPLIASSPNPVQSTASELRTSCGGSQSPIKEAAIMATIPALSQPEITITNGRVVTTSIAIAEFDRMEKQLWEQKQLALSSPAMNINFPLSWFSEHHPYATMNYVDRNTLQLDTSVLFDMPSPAMRIFNELRRNGYNVDAAVAEFNAFKHLTEEMRRKLLDISRTSEKSSRFGFNVNL
ncbi:ash family protein [Escherichia coli]